MARTVIHALPLTPDALKFLDALRYLPFNSKVVATLLVDSTFTFLLPSLRHAFPEEFAKGELHALNNFHTLFRCHADYMDSTNVSNTTKRVILVIRFIYEFKKGQKKFRKLLKDNTNEALLSEANIQAFKSIPQFAPLFEDYSNEEIFNGIYTHFHPFENEYVFQNILLVIFILALLLGATTILF